jgi:TRAP-type mannitol/chloroaromatic compound transport system permease large subunit
VVGATVVTMGLISLPAMLRAGYDPKLASGVICASGTLGQIIPPSTVLIFMGDMLAGINAQVQMAKGNFAPDAGLGRRPVRRRDDPGLLLVGLYSALRHRQGDLRPEVLPGHPRHRRRACRNLGRDRADRAAAAAAAHRRRCSARSSGASPRRPSRPRSAPSARWCWPRQAAAQLRDPARRRRSTPPPITSMVFVILLGASVFSIVFRMMGGDNLVHDMLCRPAGRRDRRADRRHAVMFVLGFILDTFEIIFIVIPITAPVLLNLGVDPLWLGVWSA